MAPQDRIDHGDSTDEMLLDLRSISVVFRGKINWSKLLRHDCKICIESDARTRDRDLILVERCDGWQRRNDNSISSNPDKPIKGEVIASFDFIRLGSENPLRVC